MDKLISFHAYGAKFTEFKNGEPRNGDEANETYERTRFWRRNRGGFFNRKGTLRYRFRRCGQRDLSF